MSGFDFVIILGVLFFVILGFRDGLFKKIYAIVGFWGGLILATKLMIPVGKSLTQIFDFSKATSLIVAFSLIFLLFIVAENLFYRWFGTGAASESLTLSSRLGGTVIGAFQGLLAVSLMLVMLKVVDIPDEETQKESTFYSPVFMIAPQVFDQSTSWIPESKAFFDEIRDHLRGVPLP